MSGSNSASPAGSHAEYRPDIDGLRAVSILAVVLYHAFPRALGSGYVGVDVFFVISGYLIGGLISAELAAGTFSFARFYGRRVRRLFPALILVLVFVLVVGWNVMFPEEFRLLGRHVMAASLFISNFPLMGEIGYFSPDGHSKPLLHLWSLGIEEQFYVFWPILAVLTRRSRRTFLWITVVVALASFALSVTSDTPGLAFYQPWTRFWELAAGVLVAHIPAGAAAWWRAADRVRLAGCIAGLGLILFAATSSNLSGFPGWWAVVPVAGAALVLAGGPDTFLSRHVLACRPMVFVGKISYPLYLWHWPLLAFSWIACGSFPPQWLIVTMVAASFVLAWLTYAFVERPARFELPSRRVVGLCVPAMIVLGAIGILTMALDGIPDRRVARVNRLLIEDTSTPTRTRMSDGSCEKAYGIATGESFTCQVNAAAPAMLVFGDSVSMAFHSAISVGLVVTDAVLVATPAPFWNEPSCLAVETLETWSKGSSTCQRVTAAAFSILDKTPSIKAVVVSSFSDNHFFNNPERVRQLQEAIARRGRKLVLLGAAPAFYHTPEGCHPRRIALAGIDLTAPTDIDSCREERRLVEATLANQIAAFSRMARETPGLGYFDALPAFCDKEMCFQSDERGPLFWTWGHVNERGSVRLLDLFLPWLRTNVLKKE